MSNSKTAFITGITGQDGSYLAEFLLERDYKVVGFGRKSSFVKPNTISHLAGKIEIAYGDLIDSVSLASAIQRYKPDEVYNLASQSHPGESWNLSLETGEATALGAHRLFDAVRMMKPDCRIYQASSSEMFGEVVETPQTESTPFNPVNPYAAAKVYAHNIAHIYRKSYGLFIACGILFNHESPRRGMHFITQKVTYGAACIKLGIMNSPAYNEEGEPIVKNGKLSLGNLDAKRDWGYAGDYAEAMWLMLQLDKPDDFVIGTGKIRTIRELCQAAFDCVGLEWENYVIVDPRFVRPTETGPTVADASKARTLLDWTPKTRFKEMISMMVNHHLEILSS
ncbi:GDP-mannose 4,6-dehydratase [Methylocaldum sp.]|uniref:GDP-mannose 4,6-dehydratase n=1 Tax=Methylocaldum sp. TaxID=1969727 RepID=UPI002D6AC34D|nr:GDP-mannose 4,6-dehydratase [Methylocaldum sp.]HYE37788.1 GDP-mannose 4,6-dehydratase [Methylocaldum sp.]